MPMSIQCIVYSPTVSKIEAADVRGWNAVLVVMRACGSSIKDDGESRGATNVHSGVSMTLNFGIITRGINNYHGNIIITLRALTGSSTDVDEECRH